MRFSPTPKTRAVLVVVTLVSVSGCLTPGTQDRNVGPGERTTYSHPYKFELKTETNATVTVRLEPTTDEGSASSVTRSMAAFEQWNLGERFRPGVEYRTTVFVDGVPEFERTVHPSESYRVKVNSTGEVVVLAHNVV